MTVQNFRGMNILMVIFLKPNNKKRRKEKMKKNSMINNFISLYIKPIFFFF